VGRKKDFEKFVAESEQGYWDKKQVMEELRRNSKLTNFERKKKLL
jgi:hypothetical protein